MYSTPRSMETQQQISLESPLSNFLNGHHNHTRYRYITVLAVHFPYAHPHAEKLREIDSSAKENIDCARSSGRSVARQRDTDI
ncbi:hypothetical protein J6590_017529 [Homalodisca vitripennis]|nr:hypothetical protein J6590_017529 [Homalodisca vitripennis]